VLRNRQRSHTGYLLDEGPDGAGGIASDEAAYLQRNLGGHASYRTSVRVREYRPCTRSEAVPQDQQVAV
jgi:hypothetical protein